MGGFADALGGLFGGDKTKEQTKALEAQSRLAREQARGAQQQLESEQARQVAVQAAADQAKNQEVETPEIDLSMDDETTPAKRRALFAASDSSASAPSPSVKL